MCAQACLQKMSSNALTSFAGGIRDRHCWVQATIQACVVPTEFPRLCLAAWQADHSTAWRAVRGRDRRLLQTGCCKDRQASHHRSVLRAPYHLQPGAGHCWHHSSHRQLQTHRLQRGRPRCRPQHGSQGAVLHFTSASVKACHGSAACATTPLPAAPILCYKSHKVTEQGQGWTAHA